MRNVVGPTTSSVLTICSRNPVTIDAIAITVAMPITTPRIVRPERSLLARSWSRAIRQLSRTACRAILLSAQCVDGVEAGRPDRRVGAEDDAHHDPEAERDADRPQGDARGERRGRLDRCREPRARDQAGRPPEQRQRHRLGEELTANVATRSPERFA